ncbi:hypothetical protein [Mycobacterium sp.]|uniref:hypothetical protein n=1 Tax=Mycobacterium sp. TaxID=1785 RepID=UPI002C0F1D60|nr:hypothetical protein [Mycobacterium sp.]HTQ22477.1 hypothetical protein [Mycobacterium sp.]
MASVRGMRNALRSSTHLSFIVAVLHHHHAAEDDLIWPKLYARAHRFLAGVPSAARMMWQLVGTPTYERYCTKLYASAP